MSDNRVKVRSRAELGRQLDIAIRDIKRLTGLAVIHRQFIQMLLKNHATLNNNAAASASNNRTGFAGDVIGIHTNPASSFPVPSLDVMWRHVMTETSIQAGIP